MTPAPQIVAKLGCLSWVRALRHSSSSFFIKLQIPIQRIKANACAQIMSELGRLSRAARAKAQGGAAQGVAAAGSSLRSSTSAPGTVGQGGLGGGGRPLERSPAYGGRQPPLMGAVSQPEGAMPELLAYVPLAPRGS